MQKVTHCPMGHPYEGENLCIIPGRKRGGERRCRECRRINDRAYYYRTGRDRRRTRNKERSERI